MDASSEAACLPSSSNSTIPPWKYNVFLSFRGEDTRKSFTAHLHDALQKSGIKTFIDNDLERGDVISDQLLRTIDQSLISLVILSQNYASSTWCLDELQRILECRKSLRREVIPVFYNIDPSDVRHQRGVFADAFKSHSERFTEDIEKVQRWRNALKEVANISGYDSKDRLETKFIEEIVAGVWKKLLPSLPCYKTKFVGMESKIEEVNSILKMGLTDVRLLGIWGMGGIGKTSLARVIYEINRNQFDHCYFVADVRDVCEKEGLISLQKKFLSQNGKSRRIEFADAYEGMKIIIRSLSYQKVLIVLDDVSEWDQLEYLAIKQSCLAPRSRVIVTTRNKQLLIAHGEFKMYEAKLLNNKESLKLFCQWAFKCDKPVEGYLELSKSVVKYAAGLPLTLEVLGHHFCGRDIHQWIDALEKIKKVPRYDILKRLRISYDALDPMEKRIFLDISCFFKGMQKDKVVQILEICGFHPMIGIRILLEKCLLFEYQDLFHKWRLGMHDMIQEMGKSIVLEESPSDASRRSRLWIEDDINHVLTKNKGTDGVEVIHLRSLMKYKTNWGPEAFSMMHNLRILIISCEVCLPFGLKCLPDSLKILQWKKYPLKSLPIGVHLHKLLVLKMHCSKIVQLWSETMMFEKLKFIDLSYSEDLIQTPEFFMLPNLEQLVLKGCIKLVQVHPSLGDHKKIAAVNFKDCRNLKALPCRLEMDSLERLILSGCSKLKKLPEFGENMKYLSILELKDCKNLVCLPSSIINLKSLKTLNIFGCSNFCSLPEKLGEIESIEELDVSGTALREIPSSIVDLKHLRRLYASGCSGNSPDSSQRLLSPILAVLGFRSYEAPIRLTLPPSISGLSSLTELILRNCNLNAGSIPNDLSCLPSLACLDLSENDFGNLPSGSCVLPFLSSSLPSLTKLHLEGCNLCDASIPDDLSSFSSLCVLLLSRNDFTNLPSAFVSNLLHLFTLELNGCNRLLSLPDVPPNIDFIDAVGCHPSMELLPFPELSQLCLSHSRDRYLYVPGSEIPPWFQTQKFDFLDNKKSCISIKVDICRSYGSSWGILFCFVLQDKTPTKSRKRVIHYSFCHSKLNDQCGMVETYIEPELYNPHLHFLYLSPSYQQNVCRQVELIFETEYLFGEIPYASQKVELIRKCGLCVMREGMEEWMQHQMSSEESGEDEEMEEWMQHQMPCEELEEDAIAIDAETELYSAKQN